MTLPSIHPSTCELPAHPFAPCPAGSHADPALAPPRRTELVNLGKINIISSPVDTSSVQNGNGDTVTRGGRKLRAKRTLLGLDLSPEVSPDINLSDLLDLSTINVLSAPVDTHSVQSGDGDTVTRGGRKAKRSLLNLNLSPDVSPKISLSDLLDLSKLNVLSSPVDTHSVQNGDNDSVVRGGRKRATSSVSPTVSPKISLSELLSLSKLNILSAPVDTHSEQNGDNDTVVRGGRKRSLNLNNLLASLGVSSADISKLNLGSVDISPDVSPDVDLSSLLSADTLNILSAPVDTHSEQNGNGDTVVRGGRMVKKVRKAKRGLLDLDLSPDVSPDVSLSELLDLDTINVLSSPVDTSSVQNGDGDTVTRGGRK